MPPVNTYDVVITGGGLGGMLCAVLLAKEGMKVCVLERDKQIGGCLQTFSVHKKVFDSCVHYIGGLGEGHTLHSILKYAGVADQLKLAAYDTNCFDAIAFGEAPTLYPHAQGKENFVEQLASFFPEERKALENYINTISFVGDQFPLYRLRNGDAKEKATVSSWEVSKTIAGITKNEKLKHVLAGNNLLYAGIKGRTPFYMHALATESYIHSSHKVLPGSSQISKLLWKQLQSYGGKVYRDNPVTLMKEENGKMQYAQTADGRRFYGKQFIAAMHPDVLLGILESSLIRPAYKKRIRGLEQTTSCFMLNLVLQRGTVPMRHHNIYWHAKEDTWSAIHYTPNAWPANYAAFFTEDEHHKGYAESISILSYMHYNEVKQWEPTINYTSHEQERGIGYEAFKQHRTELLIEKLYKQIPELKGNIADQSAATPLTYRDYTASPEGSLYGILKDVNKPSETQIAVRTKIPNLLLTGQNVNLHGVLGVSITAVATSAELIGMDHILSRINSIK